MRSYDVLPAMVFFVGIHAFLALNSTLVAGAHGWPSLSDSSWDTLGWFVATMYLGAPWSALAAGGTGAGWDALFIVGPWINVAIHGGLWTLLVRRPAT